MNHPTPYTYTFIPFKCTYKERLIHHTWHTSLTRLTSDNIRINFLQLHSELLYVPFSKIKVLTRGYRSVKNIIYNIYLGVEMSGYFNST